MEKQVEQLRAYFFNNMYLQGLHAGIQSQHTTAEMFVKYDTENIDCDCWSSCECYTPSNVLYNWAQDHKTTIVLNGGMQGDLEEVKELLSSFKNPHPWSFFNETEYALGGALTNVGIILPEKIYNAPRIDPIGWDEFFESYRLARKLTDWEVGFIKILQSKRLMN